MKNEWMAKLPIWNEMQEIFSHRYNLRATRLDWEKQTCIDNAWTLFFTDQ